MNERKVPTCLWWYLYYLYANINIWLNGILAPYILFRDPNIDRIYRNRNSITNNANIKSEKKEALEKCHV